ncbi:MAG: tripartite tricarboxylate transporter substrate binding protein [Burkholderiales bacterium]
MRRVQIVTLLLLCMGCASAVAQQFPSRPLRVIVTFPPGGITDFTGRILAPRLAEALGQPVIVENKTGSGGNIGTDFVAKATPDGHTLLVVAPPNAINVTLYKTLPFDTRRDLAPIVLVGSVPNVLVVGPKTQAKNVQELVDFARRNPGKLNFASNGTGTSIQLSSELMKMQGNFFALHIPYRGAPAATAALLAGDVDFMFDSLSVSLPHIRAGKIRVLAVSSRTRSALLPDTPTMIEGGFPDFETTGWTGMMTTGGTPPAVIARLESELLRILAMPEVISAFEKPGMNVRAGSAKDMATFLDKEIERWSTAVKYSGAQAD